MSLARNIGDLPNGDDAPLFGCRAWVNFHGGEVTNPASMTGVRDSGNISSILDNGQGDYTINFTTAMPDDNYCTNVTIGNFGSALMHIKTDSSYNVDTYSTSAVRVATNVAFDPKVISVAIFR